MNELSSQPAAPNDEIHLLDYLIVLAKHSQMIVYISAAVTLLTYLILFCQPNKYTALARLLPPQQNMTLSAQLLDQLGARTLPAGGQGGPMGGIAANLLGLRSPGDLYVGMLTGNTIYGRIVGRFKLQDLYHIKYLEDARKKLSNRAEIKSGKDGLITIEVTDENPQRAAEMANAFIEELDKLLQGMAHNEAKERLTFLERELHQASQKLSQAEEAMRCFSEKSSVLQIDAQTRSMLEYIATLRATIDSKEVQLLVLRQQATPMNYDLIRIETELKGLREKLRATEAQEARNLCGGETMIATAKVPSLGLEYLRLFRDVKFHEGQYQLYNKLVELARMDQVRTAAVVQVVDWALPPEKRSNTQGRKALLAGGLTFFTMIFVAFIKEYWDQARIREEESRRLAILSQYLQPWLQSIKNITSFILSIFRNKKPS